MFAAGPATNLFAALVMFLLLGGLATQLVAEEEYVHVQGIVLEGGADQAGMQPWDTLISIDGEPVHTTDDFRNILAGYASNQTVDLVVVHQNGERETLQATFGDKHQHYLDLGYSEELLDSLDVLPGDPFLGVEGLSEGTAGIDRLAGPLSPRFEGTWGQRALSMPFHLLTVLVIPFEMGGVAIPSLRRGVDGRGGRWRRQPPWNRRLDVPHPSFVLAHVGQHFAGVHEPHPHGAL